MESEDFPRVLQIIPSFQASGGVERGTLDISQALLEKTGKAFVLSSGGDLVKPFEDMGGTHIELPVHSKNPFKILQNIGKIQRVITDFKIDIVHVRSRAPAWSTFVASRTLRVPLVTTYHAPYNAATAWKRYYNSVMARGDHVIAISSFIEKHIQENYQHLHWFDRSKIRVIPRGIDTDFFNPDQVSQEKREALRLSLKLPKDAKILLLPGRLTRWKGQRLVLEAFIPLHQQFPEALIVFAGNPQGRDKYVRELENFATQHGLGEKLRILPHVADLPTLYSLAYAVISASIEPEGFGRVMAEAGAMERPVIASDQGASSEIVLPEQTGYLFQTRNKKSLQKALERILMLDQASYKAFGKKAKSHVLEHFSKHPFCEKTLDLYDKLNRRKEGLL